MNIWLIITVWVIFVLYTWMIADLQRALVTYLRAKKIKVMYEVMTLHNAAAEYSEKIMKEHPEKVAGCKFPDMPEGPPLPPVG